MLPLKGQRLVCGKSVRPEQELLYQPDEFICWAQVVGQWSTVQKTGEDIKLLSDGWSGRVSWVV